MFFDVYKNLFIEEKVLLEKKIIVLSTYNLKKEYTEVSSKYEDIYYFYSMCNDLINEYNILIASEPLFNFLIDNSFPYIKKLDSRVILNDILSEITAYNGSADEKLILDELKFMLAEYLSIFLEGNIKTEQDIVKHYLELLIKNYSKNSFFEPFLSKLREFYNLIDDYEKNYSSPEVLQVERMNNIDLISKKIDMLKDRNDTNKDLLINYFEDYLNYLLDNGDYVNLEEIEIQKQKFLIEQISNLSDTQIKNHLLNYLNSNLDYLAFKYKNELSNFLYKDFMKNNNQFNTLTNFGNFFKEKKMYYPYLGNLIKKSFTTENEEDLLRLELAINRTLMKNEVNKLDSEVKLEYYKDERAIITQLYPRDTKRLENIDESINNIEKQIQMDKDLLEYNKNAKYERVNKNILIQKSIKENKFQLEPNEENEFHFRIIEEKIKYENLVFEYENLTEKESRLLYYKKILEIIEQNITTLYNFKPYYIEEVLFLEAEKFGDGRNIHQLILRDKIVYKKNKEIEEERIKRNNDINYRLAQEANEKLAYKESLKNANKRQIPKTVLTFNNVPDYFELFKEKVLTKNNTISFTQILDFYHQYILNDNELLNTNTFIDACISNTIIYYDRIKPSYITFKAFYILIKKDNSEEKIQELYNLFIIDYDSKVNSGQVATFPVNFIISNS